MNGARYRVGRGSISATELAKLGLCETKLILDRTHGEGKISARAKARRREGTQVHAYSQQAAVNANGAVDRRCFVATAVYGPDGWQTDRLRRWRDRCLLPSSTGRVLVAVYYRVSPWLVTRFGRSLSARWVARSLLDFLVARIAS